MNYQAIVDLEKYDDLRIFYSKRNLAQLIFLQEQLGKNWLKNNAVKNAVLGYDCGLMRGPSKKMTQQFTFR